MKQLEKMYSQVLKTGNQETTNIALEEFNNLMQRKSPKEWERTIDALSSHFVQLIGSDPDDQMPFEFSNWMSSLDCLKNMFRRLADYQLNKSIEGLNSYVDLLKADLATKALVNFKNSNSQE